MDFNATIDLIIRDLEEAREIIDDLKKYQGVPFLQVELAKSKCKSASEVIALLKQEIPGQKTEDRRPKSEDRRPETEEEGPKTEDRRPKSEDRRPETEDRRPKAENATIGDSFSHLSSRFNEQLGNRKPDDDLSGIMKTKPITSLTEAIGINDRFLFIREIFGGNKDTYSQAVTRLENAASITDARAVIMSYTGENSENSAVKQLLDLVKRKLSSNE